MRQRYLSNLRDSLTSLMACPHCLHVVILHVEFYMSPQYGRPSRTYHKDVNA